MVRGRSESRGYEAHQEGVEAEHVRRCNVPERRRGSAERHWRGKRDRRSKREERDRDRARSPSFLSPYSFYVSVTVFSHFFFSVSSALSSFVCGSRLFALLSCPVPREHKHKDPKTDQHRNPATMLQTQKEANQYMR